jgi:hypothetical protein
MKNTGARYEIAIDGVPRTHRDRQLAIEAATLLKTKQPHAEVTGARHRDGQDDQRQASVGEALDPRPAVSRHRRMTE